MYAAALKKIMQRLADLWRRPWANVRIEYANGNIVNHGVQESYEVVRADIERFARVMRRLGELSRSGARVSSFKTLDQQGVNHEQQIIDGNAMPEGLSGAFSVTDGRLFVSLRTSDGDLSEFRFYIKR